MTIREQIESILNDRTLPTGYHKAILIALSFDQNNCEINQSELMKMAGIGSRNTLVSTVQELERLGWLKVDRDKDEENRFANNRYEVVIPNAKVW
jgi:DNA-binding HxlR family transcriptional regulator